MEVRLRGNIVVGNLLDIRLANYLDYERSDPVSIERKLRVLAGEIAPQAYALKCFELVQKYAETNEKRKLEFLARETVTTLQNLGVSSAHINSVVCEYFFGDDPIKDSESLQEFFRQIFPHKHKFSVWLKLTSFIHNVPSEFVAGVKIATKRQLPKSLPNESIPSSLRVKEKGETYIVVKEVEAMDKVSAVKEARSRVDSFHDLFGLFHHKGRYSFGEYALVEQKCCSGNYFTVKSSVNRMHFISDNTVDKAYPKLAAMFSELKLHRGEDKTKFSRVIDFHGMSSQSEVVENQLLNLWTSLETIVPRTKGAIVGGVVEGVLPFIGLNYCRRLFKTLTFDLVRWDRRSLSKVIKDSENRNESDLVEKIFNVIVLKENEKSLKLLFESLRNYELLKYRVFQINEMFGSPQETYNAITKHQQRVRWQLHRIYRTRNSIVHSGQKSPFIDTLVMNAHDYFDQVFDLSTTFCSGPKGFDNYTDCFNHAKWLFDQYLSDIKAASSFDCNSYKMVLWKPSDGPKRSDFFR